MNLSTQPITSMNELNTFGRRDYDCLSARAVSQPGDKRTKNGFIFHFSKSPCTNEDATIILVACCRVHRHFSLNSRIFVQGCRLPYNRPASDGHPVG